MKTSDYISSTLSLIAIVISLIVWRTTDTRESELREKVIRYSVEKLTDTVTHEPSHRGKKKEAQEGTVYLGEKLIEQTDTIKLDIVNTGTLPTKDVTITTPTQSPTGKIPPYQIELEPAKEYDPIVRSTSLVIHFKNPIGPHEEVNASVVFRPAKKGQEAVKSFYPKDPFVDSEVGGASLIGSSTGGQSNF